MAFRFRLPEQQAHVKLIRFLHKNLGAQTGRMVSEVNFPGNFQWAFVVDELASVVELTYIEKAQCGPQTKGP